MKLKNIYKHFVLITRHKMLVFKLCVKAGIPLRGFMHDWSKYSPTEFFESVKYFTGTRSPIEASKEDKGYSMAWLHHRGRNKHHYEYWVDYLDKGGIPALIPYKYALEMCCDMLAAGMIYKGKTWESEYPLVYWNSKVDTVKMHEAIKIFLTKFFTLVSKYGVESINRKTTYKMYKDSLSEYEKSTRSN